jgi:hypothetical protein
MRTLWPMCTRLSSLLPASDHGVADRAPVHGAVRPDLDVVLDHAAADLGTLRCRPPRTRSRSRRADPHPACRITRSPSTTPGIERDVGVDDGARADRTPAPTTRGPRCGRRRRAAAVAEHGERPDLHVRPEGDARPTTAVGWTPDAAAARRGAGPAEGSAPRAGRPRRRADAGRRARPRGPSRPAAIPRGSRPRRTGSARPRRGRSDRVRRSPTGPRPGRWRRPHRRGGRPPGRRPRSAEDGGDAVGIAHRSQAAVSGRGRGRGRLEAPDDFGGQVEPGSAATTPPPDTSKISA